MKDITTKEAVKILKDIPFYEQVENHDVEGQRYIFKTNNRLKQARDIVLDELEKYKQESIDTSKIIRKLNLMINAMAEVIEECRQNDCIESEDIDLSQIAGAKAIKQYFERKVTE